MVQAARVQPLIDAQIATPAGEGTTLVVIADAMPEDMTMEDQPVVLVTIHAIPAQVRLPQLV